MRRVRLRLHQEHFSTEMEEMRRWLDQDQYEPTSFGCYQKDDEILIYVEFRREDAAVAFGKRFDGEIGTPSALVFPQPASDEAKTDHERLRRLPSGSRSPRRLRRSG